MVLFTCEKANRSNQLVNLMYKWKRSLKLIKKTLIAFQFTKKSRMKALHMLCKKVATENENNSEYHDFVKINELPFVARDKLFSMFIIDKLTSYAHTAGSYKKYLNSKNYKNKTTTLSNNVKKKSLFEVANEIKFSLYREPLILKNHLMRLLLAKESSAMSKVKKTIRFKLL